VAGSRNKQVNTANQVMLTKSNFKLGAECLHKLKYYKAKYPSTKNDNEMLKFFAEGGFMVEAIAHAVMSANPNVEFEKTLESGRFTARIDAFEQTSDQIVLTEIKAKSIKSSDPDQFFLKTSRTVNGTWREYMLDIAYQVMVTEMQFPDLKVVPQLCLVNSSKSCGIEAIYSNVDVILDNGSRDFSLPSAVYTGDVRALRADHFLEFINVRECVDSLMDEVKTEAQRMLNFLDGQMPNASPDISTGKCKTCEYRDADTAQDGFTECWGKTPPRGGHIIDLFRVGNGNNALKTEVDVRISTRQFNLADLPDTFLDGGSSYEMPRRHQLAAVRTGAEVCNPKIAEVFSGVTYPLVFMDFEASRIPVPYHAGMKPYELVAFQFSCHIIESPDSTDLLHHEWLNLQDVYPNEDFIKNLRQVVGDKGTILVWSQYEASLLKEVRRQLQERGQLTGELMKWFTGVLGGDNESGTEIQSRILDLLKVSEANYYHPAMKGSHSIKKVLDAVWSGASDLWTHPWFGKYFAADENGNAIDPYKTLARPDNFGYLGDTEDSDEYAVTDGVGAMRAYQDMLFGLNRHNLALRESMRDSLLRYCELDTAAMVMIWEYWKSL
jgi:hypothetical protein